MIFRLYHETKGGHVHCRLFAGKQEGALGKCGDLTMRVDEFELFQARALGSFDVLGMQFEPEPGPSDGVTYAARLAAALTFCRDLAVEELAHAKVGTGAEVVLRHIVRKAEETLG